MLYNLDWPWTPYVAKDDLKLVTLLPLPPGCCDWRHAPTCTIYMVLKMGFMRARHLQLSHIPIFYLCRLCTDFTTMSFVCTALNRRRYLFWSCCKDVGEKAQTDGVTVWFFVSLGSVRWLPWWVWGSAHSVQCLLHKHEDLSSDL